jgi:indole-3-glycerol phosphate synthase
MNDVLQRIVATTRARLEARPIDVAEARRAALACVAGRGAFAFSRALRGGPAIRVIAEVKAASPSAGAIVENPNVEAIASAYKAGGASAISIVTEPDFFRGSRDWIGRAVSANGLPVIMKDFIVEESQLLEGVAAGASAILLLASLLDADRIAAFIAVLDEFGVDALVEVHDEAELERAVGGGARLIGVNNRDLRNFDVRLETSERLIRHIPAEAIKVSESGIRTRADVERLHAAGFDAFLVGESLLRQSDRAAAVRELVG